MIFRRKFKDLWENHILKYWEQWPFMRDWYNAQNKEITLPNRAVIAFRYAEHERDIDDFLGIEYMDMVIDEATQLTERALTKFEGSNRWPGVADDACKILHTMNPGGPGHAFMRRIYIKGEYHENERPEDYAFVPVRAWDNVEWARAALAEASLSDRDYYGWTDGERFKFFIERTQYGRKLNALPAALRIGWLLGDWDQFAGQYFDVFDVNRHISPCVLNEWFPRWIGIDWGFAHNSAAYWNAQDGEVTKTYREMVIAGRSPKALAQEIVDRTQKDAQFDERKRIDAIYLSPDAFARKASEETWAMQMGEVFMANGMPEPISADNDTIGGAALLYELLRSDQWQIDPSCVKLIETLPMVTRDEDDPEHTVKFEGDDPFDAAKYALKSRLNPRGKPYETRVVEKVETFAATRGLTMDTLEPTSRAMLIQQAMRLEKRNNRGIRYRFGRRFRPGAMS